MDDYCSSPQSSMRDIALKHQVSLPSLKMQLSRHGLYRRKREIMQVAVQTAVDITTSSIIPDAKKWVHDTLDLSSKLQGDILNSRENMLPVIDPDALTALSTALKRVDDVARRSLGLPDAPTRIESQGVVVMIDGNELPMVD